MSHRPDPVELQQPTSATLVSKERASESEGGDISDAEAGESHTRSGASAHDILLLAAIVFMLVWPWVLLGVIWAVKGVQLTNGFAKLVTSHPHGITFFATLLGNIVSLIVSILFSFAIIRYAQEWVTVTEDVTVYHVSVLSAFRNQSWPFKMKDMNLLFIRTKWLTMVLLGVCIAAFTLVPSSTTSLITPIRFNRHALLNGTELDLSSTATDCLAWFAANPISNNCDWEVFNSLDYTDCLGENQIVDVVEAGRASILSLIPNNSQSLTLSQLGAQSGLHFLGPIRGVLPIGPNGVPAFNSLQASPLDQTAEMLSYNYTLEHQGLASNVSCRYDTESPITFEPIPYANNSLMLSSSGSCGNGLVDFLPQWNITQFTTLNTDNTLTFWSCKSVPTGGEQPTYYVYLRGRVNYATAIGNITCAVTPIQPAIFPVVYQSGPGIFITQNRTATFASIFPGFIERALVALGGIVWESQNIVDNLVAESVITFGVKSFNLPPYTPNNEYLRLYQAMLQGIMEYETTYSRLVYSTTPNRPQSCDRVVTGSVSYIVLGWFAKADNIGYLMPMTLVNLASLCVLIRAMLHAKGGGYRFDPTKPHALLAASSEVQEDKPIEWEDKVKFRKDELTTGLVKAAKNLQKPGIALGSSLGTQLL